MICSEIMDKMASAIQKGHVRVAQLDNLRLYKYTDKCTHEKGWDDFTRIARGLILEDSNEFKLVAYPFPKFFNLNEMPESSYNEIIKHSEYEVYDKLDGSLGITYLHDGKVKIATRGSFESEQAIEATKMLHELHPEFCDLSIHHNIKFITFLFEIIYPSNKIVCNYNGERKLVMLGAFCYNNIYNNIYKVGEEIERYILSFICEKFSIPIVEQFSHSIDEMIELQKTLPKDKEGFVVRFPNGLRVKFKGDEYLRIHKLVTMCSPLSVWENMKYAKLTEEVRLSIPEEYLGEFKKIESQLQSNYWKVYQEIVDEFIINFKVYYFEKAEWDEEYLEFTLLPTPEERKEVGLYIKENADKLKHASCIFPLILNKLDGVDKYVMDKIRPNANNLERFEE